MRVTNKMLSNTFLSDMSNNLTNMQKLQSQLSSGKEIRKPSDDPFKVARSMQLNTDINANEQYNENITNTINWLDTTDTALGQAGNVLQRVRELVISAGNGSFSHQERTAIKDEINAKVGELAQILNTNFDGKYIFGGSRGLSKPVATITNDTATNGAVINIKNGTPPVPGKVEATVNGTLPTVTPPTADTTFNMVVNSKAGTTVDTLSISTSTDDGTTYSAPIVVTGTASGANMIFDLSSVDATKYAGMTVTIPNDTASVTNSLNDIFKFAATSANTEKNTKLVYNSDNPNAVELAVDKNLSANMGNGEINMINSKLNVEISQGVKLEYNVSASDIMQFTNEDGQTSDLRQTLSKLINHLDGKNDEGTALDSTATSKINKEDLTAITDSINNLLKIRSQVGSKQNIMDSAADRNEAETYNMTDILSKTEDIDITKKSLEFATAQTVYLAALQTSAKILQPTLLDYLR